MALGTLLAQTAASEPSVRADEYLCSQHFLEAYEPLVLLPRRPVALSPVALELGCPVLRPSEAYNALSLPLSLSIYIYVTSYI